ncbi:uncharacterized protein BO95DRAFT_432969 [Aspergillus brunneoviolaceus CBS 621.78]|uniref:Uncharacterized protein n=1 Tax=Aspergillus brunneoviolaceus CBS 621.78 TaxID=1450534 RepID=A0ACD1G5X0_9EURO|nr:hypothetical protein BO95DRAFT_432969 [Aspergillus brunneoviolaceus CBS 621.78]RAH44619.1 hypothetical protein BO95DRAFT_432969 [Aspergillus brunneoviolaceus CBS 621.78]
MSEEIVLFILLLGAMVGYVLLYADSSDEDPGDKVWLKSIEVENPIVILQNSTVAMRAARAGAPVLKTLWRLNNPFVSDSVDLQLSYRHALYKALAKVDDSAWVGIARVVGKAIQPLFTRRTIPGGCTVTADLRQVSLTTSLAAVLKALFEIENIGADKLSYLGSDIHRISVKGKRHAQVTAAASQDIPEDLRGSADALIQALRHVFIDAAVSTELAETILYRVSGSPPPEEFNPLNLLLPAFEAPWRSTLYTLLAVLQPGARQPKYVLALRDCRPDHNPDPLALAIAYESLRLYPPIRCISRVPTSVDIEAIQRDPSHWGPTAQQFHPERFLTPGGRRIRSSLVGPQQFAWISFAAGKMKCPSARVFSIRMIVVVVGEILRQLFPGDATPEWEFEGAEWDAAARRGKALRAGREEYEGVRIVSVCR